MDESSEWSELSVTELKDALREIGMPISGRKKVLVTRLEEYSIFQAELADTKSEEDKSESFLDRIRDLPFPALVVISILIVGSSGGAVIYGDEILDFIQGEPEYVLIDFDNEKAREFAQTLVDLGHPEWEGRMSGTVEEENTANSIKSNFTSMGIPSTMDEFDVNMFEIGSEPDLSICTPGDIGSIFGGPTPCSAADVNRDITQFTHREDYVIQGYSGSIDVFHTENAEIVDLGNGSEDSDWASAASKIAMIWIESGTDGNTD
ncbi:MAG TPA: SAP domain-containing protein, partial [Candidatus Thalassarchaeaceae archaeon]